jgi:hypothetical protein
VQTMLTVVTQNSRLLRRSALSGDRMAFGFGHPHRSVQRSSTRKPPRVRKRGAWLDPSGYDAGKKIKGRKRHILVDTLGLLLNVVVHIKTRTRP